MPKAASLKNLRPWKPGQSGNPNGRPRAPRFTERDQHAILSALAGAFGEGAQRAAINAMQAVLTKPPNGPQGPGVCAVERGTRLAAPGVASQEIWTSGSRCVIPGPRGRVEGCCPVSSAPPPAADRASNSASSHSRRSLRIPERGISRKASVSRFAYLTPCLGTLSPEASLADTTG
jgi:hypothetical protein